MEIIHSIKVSGRVCCAINDEVWVAKHAGGIAVFSARSGDFLRDVDVQSCGAESAQVTRMTAVFDEVWVATNSGDVHFYNALRHRCVDTLHIPGAEKKVQVVELCFNGRMTVIATESGSLYLHDSLSHKRIGTLSTSTAPCTAATLLEGFVVGGDANGGLYVWNPLTGECLAYHGESTSKVVALLHEPTMGTVWVSRANESVDVYAFSAEGLKLQRRVSGLGKVTGMTAVSATVVATTLTKRVVQIDAATAKVIEPHTSPLPSSLQHASFIHGCCKTMHQEVAQVWTIGNDAMVHVWRVAGKQVPAVPVPTLPSAAQAALIASAGASAKFSENELRVEVLTERQRRDDMVEDLRKSREEAQELRLRLARKEDSLRIVEEELAAEKKLRKEADERIASLTKGMTEIASKVSMVERERSTLQSEVTQLQIDLSKANTNFNTKQTEKSAAEQQLSQERTNKSTLEQRLRDAEAKLSSMQAENRRLCESTSTAASPFSLTREAQESLVKNSATLVSDLERARKLNQLLSSAMASMEYTIRRREEEDKDLTALLNAYRHRVADRISDPHLSSLLLATIVRNAPRFDLECDPFTKVQLMDRNGPFLQFIQSLRATDPEAYERLMQYLQNPAALENLNADAQALLDRIVSLAAKEGEVSGEDIISFKRSIPGFVDGVGATNVSPAASAPVISAPAISTPVISAPAASTVAANSSSIESGGLAGIAGTALNSLAALLRHDLPSSIKTVTGENAAQGSITDNGFRKPDQEVVDKALICELRGQKTVDENAVRQQETMFEFIIKTRGLLVESVVLLHKRTASARHVIEALCVNTGAAGSSGPNVRTPRTSLQPLQRVFAGIMRELDFLASEVVQRYLTSAEKQRHGVTLA
ncbi:hypothetical protein ABL78_6665 [Leptomonas seymouri]|uniref:Uncharacterized protein n=1 Tax=Leptomonas seymouri TaxID=5684 RepID=A0A0N1HV16_LEPSE|nr:hypothetical protein ABL78_6665 [Leptomonas seymouri]|eukprot:KPI84274.1 hypothetical protein ABL78_6665 [Leptomonas seymouri]